MKKLTLEMFNSSKIGNVVQLKQLVGGEKTYQLVGWGSYDIPGTDMEATYNDWKGDGDLTQCCCNAADNTSPFDYCLEENGGTPC